MHKIERSMKFVNRVREIQRLRSQAARFWVLFGRRRVGKTALVKEVMRLTSGHQEFFYTQAVEGSEALQVQQISDDIRPLVPDIVLTSWKDLLELLARVSSQCTLVIDEFPYLVKSQPSLPSMLQRWLDHQRPKSIKLILLGSSQTMMHDIFLRSHSPLYERADDILHVRPMGYRQFCEAKQLDPLQLDHYLLFSLVGGVPKYWDYIDRQMSPMQAADHLYFEVGSRLESEPDRLLNDENIVGEQAKYILEIIGRGANRPSEIAARLGIKQTSLSGPLEVLRHASLIVRETPFGESLKSTKRSLYKIYDHCLAFWYGCYSPHQVRWYHYSDETKRKLIYDHASVTFERDLRSLYRDCGRYWEKDLEIDSVRYAGESKAKLIVSEVKLGQLSDLERQRQAAETTKKFQKSQLSLKYEAQVEVLDQRAGLRALSEPDHS